MSAPLFQRLALVGLGLIGSSLARVVRREGLVAHVAGTARSRATRDATSARYLGSRPRNERSDSVPLHLKFTQST